MTQKRKRKKLSMGTISGKIPESKFSLILQGTLESKLYLRVLT